jgi:hypothetical protein
VLRRIETPGVAFAIAKAISQAARTADGTAGGLVTFVWEVAWFEAIRKRGTDPAKNMRWPNRMKSAHERLEIVP